MAQLELGDLQGIVVRGYGSLPAARYLVLRIDDSVAARRWLREVEGMVTPGDRKPDDLSFHIAFTCGGLRALGLDEGTLATFSREFWEGMHAPHRARNILGDRDASAPVEWRWGGADAHVLLLLYARDTDTLEALHRQVGETYAGVTEIQSLETYSFESSREHFGFNDGIAQPVIRGLSKSGPPENTLSPGEFILGYPNEYGKLPSAPRVARAQDPAELLPRVRWEEGEEEADLGRNGTYLVFRQLSQNVRAFWRFVDETTHLADGTSDHDARTRMAAKMVGRWPSGAPLTLCPNADDPGQSTRNDFGYRASDLFGDGCPVGAHIRRTNPRDALDGKPEESITVANRHRILRRGRPYGAPVSRTMDVDEILAFEQEHGEVGLHFICINADIGRQFEFIQHTWINNAKFGGLYSDADPIMGHHDKLQSSFTVQGAPVRMRITNLQRFVEVRGGAYFFLPGLRALRFIAGG